jgi:hypothetical protein
VSGDGPAGQGTIPSDGQRLLISATFTVVTLMTDEQLADVRDLTRKAGIKPTTTKLRVGHLLTDSRLDNAP